MFVVVVVAASDAATFFITKSLVLDLCRDGVCFAQVAVRSILLRGFDQQVAEKLGDVMKDLGVKFVRPAVPSKIEKVKGWPNSLSSIARAAIQKFLGDK